MGRVSEIRPGLLLQYFIQAAQAQVHLLNCHSALCWSGDGRRRAAPCLQAAQELTLSSERLVGVAKSLQHTFGLRSF